ncbi:MAG: transposase [Patescibacteria group bacterium]
MSGRNFDFSIGEFYHIYSRGVDKRSLFLDENDNKRFVKLLFLCNGSHPVIFRDYRDLSLASLDMGEKLVSVGAYCLMGNHFHLLLKEVTEGGIVKFMSKLLTAYSSYFNKKYQRTGALFESEFKATHASTDEYLKYLFAYIHLNPLKILDPEWRNNKINKNLAKGFLEKYLHSSFGDYIGKERDEGNVLNKAEFPEYFTGVDSFEGYLYDWLNFSDL